MLTNAEAFLACTEENVSTATIISNVNVRKATGVWHANKVT